MQAQTRGSAHVPSTVGGGRPAEFGAIVGLYFIAHSLFLVVPPLLNEDIPTSAVIVNVAFLVLGAVGLWGFWLAKRWGWWTLVILGVVDVVLNVGDIAGLEGAMRVLAIVSMVMLAAILVLLFRPGVRKYAR
jgi:hypothetical protein